MKVIIEENGNKVAVDPRTIKINGISLDQIVARVIQVEKELNALRNEIKQDNDYVKTFLKKRL